jgi:hypothetical protein
MPLGQTEAARARGNFEIFRFQKASRIARSRHDVCLVFVADPFALFGGISRSRHNRKEFF